MYVHNTRGHAGVQKCKSRNSISSQCFAVHSNPNQTKAMKETTKKRIVKFTTIKDEETSWNSFLVVFKTTAMKLVGRQVLTACLSRCAKLLLASFIFLYVIIPTLIYTNPWITKKVVFLNMVRWPPFIDLKKPEELGLPNTRNFYLNSEENVKIGVWHMLPQRLIDSMEGRGGLAYEESLKNGIPIILYLHGNGGTRGGYHRVQLYKVLRRDYHIVTLDYRGFGDSPGSPSEDGLIHDAKFVYRWLRERSGDVPVFLWGHSMGSGVTTKLAKELCEEGHPSTAVVLESPFNNFREAATHYPLSLPYRYLPLFDVVFLDSIKYNDIFLASDINIAGVTVPLMILHARDDMVVPFDLGNRLYQAALATRAPSDVQFVTFNASLGYGHKHIHKAPELLDIVRQFTDGKRDP